MSSARRNLLAGLALAGASVVVTLIALEVAFRLFSVRVGTVQINRETVRRSPNPRLLFELRPGAFARAEVDYRISSSGLRNPEVPVVKPAEVRRIAVLGDSIAFGYWVAEEQAFPRQLERMLGGVQVLNFGVPGYNLDQEIETLSTRALEFSPDLVVLAFCLNDFEDIFSHEYGLTLDRAARSVTLPGRALEGLLRRSRLASWVEYRLAELQVRRRFALARNPFGEPLGTGAAAEQKEALFAKMRMRARKTATRKLAPLRQLLASRGIPGLVVVFPTFGHPFPNYPYRALHAAVLEAAQESGLLAVDLLDCFSAYDFWDLRVDVVHPNAMGHRIAAHGIRDALCARGLLCEGAPALDVPCTGYRKAGFPRVRGY